MKDNFNSSMPRDFGYKAIVPKHTLMARLADSGIMAPSFSTALLIASNTHHGRLTQNGNNYANRYLHLALESNWCSPDDEWKMIAVLCDVVRYSDWTIDDLNRIGFSPRVVMAIDSLTPRNNEPYDKFIERCANNKDARSIKIAKLERNLSVTNFGPDHNLESIRRDQVSHLYLCAHLEGSIDNSKAFCDYAAKLIPDYYDHDYYSEGYHLEDINLESDNIPAHEHIKDNQYKIHAGKKCKPALSKEELIHYIHASGQKPNLATALLITANAMHDKKTWSGSDYANHYLWVAFESVWNIRGQNKVEGRDEEWRTIGILHDVIEDTDWTLDDLRQVGFSERVVKGVESVTKNKGEKYLDFIERCSMNPDGVSIKLRDLKHNLDLSRSDTISATEKQTTIYPLCRSYLTAVQKGEIAAGSSIHEYAIKKFGAEHQYDYVLQNYGGSPITAGIETRHTNINFIAHHGINNPSERLPDQLAISTRIIDVADPNNLPKPLHT